MEKEYFVGMIGPVDKDVILPEFNTFVNILREDRSLGIVTSDLIDQERFDLLREINLMPTHQLKSILKK